MKFNKIFRTIIFFILVITSFNLAQNPRQTWKTTRWEKNISEVCTYQASGNTYALLSRPDQGKFWIFKVNPSGEMGEMTWSTSNWQKGINAIATFENSGKNYLALSDHDNGHFWTFELTADGKVGREIWKTTKWLKGITEIETFDINGKDYLFMLRPDHGTAWVFALESDGKVGKMVWQTTNWEKGIKASSTYKCDGKNFLFLSNGTNGHAWIIELTNEGKPGKFEWSTTKWEKGINNVSVFKSGSDSYVFLLASDYGKSWIFKLDNNGTQPKHVWSTTGWQKGISGASTYSEKGVGYLFISNPENGNAWIFSNLHNISPNLAQYNSGNVTDPELKKISARIDQVYIEVVATENNLHKFNDKVTGSKNGIESADRVGDRLAEITGKAQHIHEILGYFTKIPLIGTAVFTLNTSLSQVTNQAGKVTNSFQALDQPLLRPTVNNISSAFSASNSVESTLLSISEKLKSYKQQIVNNTSGIKTEAIKANSANIINNLAAIESELKKINSEINKLSTKADKLKKIEGPANKILTGIEKVDSKLNKADKAANEVDKILNKSFKKRIGPVKINISLKKVLEGGKVGKAFKKFVDKWAKKGVNEITKKLNIPMPSLPNVDELKNELTKLKNEAAELMDNSKTFRDCCGNLRKVDAAIATDFAKMGVNYTN